MERLYKITEVQQMTRLPRKTIENACHARGQRFAVRLVKGGCWYIDIKKFEQHLNNRRLTT